MEKKCALISLIISVLVGISLYVESFDYNEVIVYTLLTFIIIYLICSVSSNFIYDIFRNAAKINRKEGAKYEKKVGSKYLRKLPDYLTPALVSFIQDESIEYNKDVLAALLKLINDGYLKIENNKIVNTNKDYSNLYEHEKYLCDAIKNRTDVKFSEFKDNLIIDATNLELVTKASNEKLIYKGLFKIFSTKLIYIPIFIVLFAIVFMITTTFDNEVSNFIASSIVLAVILFIVFLPVITIIRAGKGLSYFIAAAKKKVKLSEKGKLDQEKIYMFKNFLKEFTSLDKKNTCDIHLWDEYLIYALVLEVNKNIYNDDKLKNIVNSVQQIIVSDFMNDVLS